MALTTLGRFTGKVDAILTAFKPEGVAAAEDLEARLEVARGRLEGFARRVAEDTAQYTLGLVKSHFPEADLEPVGDGVRQTPRTLPGPTTSPAPGRSRIAWQLTSTCNCRS